MKNNTCSINPDDKMELFYSIAPDQRQAQFIYDCLRMGKPIVLRRNGQQARELVLFNWLRKRGAKITFVDNIVEFEQPKSGRGGEIAYLTRKNLVRREKNKEEKKEGKHEQPKSGKGGEPNGK